MSALALKVIACVCMLLDHIGYCIPSLFPLRAVGRLAFPLYVFLMTEGFRHTSSRSRYALRLLLFAILSQVPFGLFCACDPLYETGNVMVTLLISFCLIWLVEISAKKRITQILSWVAVIAVCAAFLFGLLHADYGSKGVLLALVFYYFGRNKGWKAALVLLLGVFAAFFHIVLFKQGYRLFGLLLGLPERFSAPTSWEWMQMFTLLSVPLILAYNGKKGWAPRGKPAKKALQYAFYAFYPIHMLILFWTIR